MQRLIGSFSAAVLVALVAATVCADEKPAGGSTKRQAVLDLLTQLETGFNAGDAKSLAACWTEDGEFVGPAGNRINGRESIEKQFNELFAARKAPANCSST